MICHSRSQPSIADNARRSSQPGPPWWNGSLPVVSPVDVQPPDNALEEDRSQTEVHVNLRGPGVRKEPSNSHAVGLSVCCGNCISVSAHHIALRIEFLLFIRWCLSRTTLTRLTSSSGLTDYSSSNHLCMQGSDTNLQIAIKGSYADTDIFAGAVESW